jgi:hypothetical protein
VFLPEFLIGDEMAHDCTPVNVICRSSSEPIDGSGNRVCRCLYKRNAEAIVREVASVSYRFEVIVGKNEDVHGDRNVDVRFGLGWQLSTIEFGSLSQDGGSKQERMEAGVPIL